MHASSLQTVPDTFSSNFNEAHSWWISKAGNGGTMLMDSPTLLAGHEVVEGIEMPNFGYIVAIWEERK
jgi:hypothetical protein